MYFMDRSPYPHHQRSRMQPAMAMSLYGIISGIATGFTIIVYYFVWAIAVVGLADVTLLPVKFARMDIMFGGYKSLQAFVHHHQNPTVTEAVKALCEGIRRPLYPPLSMVDIPISSQGKRQAPEITKDLRGTRARNRWVRHEHLPHQLQNGLARLLPLNLPPSFCHSPRLACLSTWPTRSFATRD